MSSVQEVFSQSKDTSSIIMYCGPRDIQNKPIFIIIKPGKDIVLRSPFEINNINPSDIIKLEVLKGIKATRKYGGKAKYGVVLFTLKDERLKELLKTSKKV